MQRATQSIEAAYTLTGKDINALPNALANTSIPDDVKKRMILREDYETVIDSINREENDGKPWLPNFTDKSYKKWELWSWFDKKEDGAGFVVSSAYFDRVFTFSTVGARLSFKSRAGAEWMYENFTDLVIKYFTE